MNNKNSLLGLLVAVLAFNWVERTALGLVMQDMKLDLQLTDTQLGFMSGIAFAIFYAVMGVPIARWSDRGNRVTITCVSTVLCSLAVALCGVAASFVQLLLIRVLVGVGEAGCAPAGHSLIAEHFSRAERPRAAAIYASGVPLSMVIGYFLTGWLNEAHGWRMTFILLGLPGVVLAALFAITLKDPRTLRPVTAVAGSPAQPAFMDVCRALWGNRTFRHLLVGFSIANFFVYGITQWQPAFFVRRFGIDTGTLGTWLAVIYGVVGLVGIYFGGRWGARHAHDERLHLGVTAGLYAVTGAVSPFIYLLPNVYWAFALLGLVSFGYFWTFGPVVAAIQTLVPERMRATAFAILYLFVNLIGIGLGPLAVGLVSDASGSLQIALLVFSPGYLWAAWHLWKGSLSIASDLRLLSQPPGA